MTVQFLDEKTWKRSATLYGDSENPVTLARLRDFVDKTDGMRPEVKVAITGSGRNADNFSVCLACEQTDDIS